MSTKKIREALDTLVQHATTDCQPAAAAEVVRQTIDAARAEVEAIEAACKRVAGGYIKVRSSSDEDDARVALLDQIGEEAMR